MRTRQWLVLSLMILAGGLAAGTADAARQTENVILFISDGVRWQDVFTGADESLLNKEKGGIPDVNTVKKSYWRDTPEQRRTVLLPFVWSVIAKDGQIFGNVNKGSVSRVTNGLNFSYPGYSEIVCGLVDPHMDKNDQRLNPNVNVFEWLSQRPGFEKRVAAVCAWDLFPYILNRERSGFFINAGFEPLTEVKPSPQVELLNRLMAETTPYDETARHDSFTFCAAMEYLKSNQPRVMFIVLDETDSRAHEGRYDRYLQALHRADGYLRTLWDTVQTMPQYQGKTTILFTADHGRGGTPDDWRNHGKDVKGADNTWLAVLGPDTAALGDRAQTETVTQNQIAATIAAMLGEDYCAAVPQAGLPIVDIVTTARK